MMILILLIVIGFVFWYFGILGHRENNGELRPFSHNDDPMDIAKRRFAGGEIGKEEFETLRRDLTK